MQRVMLQITPLFQRKKTLLQLPSSMETVLPGTLGFKPVWSSAVQTVNLSPVSLKPMLPHSGIESISNSHQSSVDVMPSSFQSAIQPPLSTNIRRVVGRGRGRRNHADASNEVASIFKSINSVPSAAEAIRNDEVHNKVACYPEIGRAHV